MYLNTFLSTLLYYFQNIVFIHLFHYKFENERNIRHKISSIIQYVNNIYSLSSRLNRRLQSLLTATKQSLIRTTAVAVNSDNLIAVNTDCNRPYELGSTHTGDCSRC